MQSNSVKRFTIDGLHKYSCIMDDRRVIIGRHPIPPRNDFLWKTVDEIFSKHRDKLTFELVGEEDYPETDTDKYMDMKEKNPALAYLKKKFKTEIY